MRHTSVVLLYLIFNLSLSHFSYAQEKVLGLFTWQPSPNHIAWVLPIISDQSKKETILNYLQATENERITEGLIPRKTIYELKLQLESNGSEQFQNLNTTQKGEIRTLLIANKHTDYHSMYKTPDRILYVRHLLKQNNSSSYLLPIFHDISYSQEIAESFRHSIHTKFKLVIHLGGEDIIPRLYNKAHDGAVNTNRERDMSEARFLVSYLDNADKYGNFVFAICRGYQLLVALLNNIKAYAKKKFSTFLTQNLPRKTSYQHGDGYWVRHPIDIEKDSLLSSVLNAGKKLRANIWSQHHQAGNLTGSSHELPAYFSAKAPDQTPEAIEPITRTLVDKNFLGVQFHPEYDNENGPKFFRNLLKHVRKRSKTYSCRSSISALSS